MIVIFKERGAIISNLLTYCHSGSLGDLIYSLPVVKHFGRGDFYIKLHAGNYTSRKYGYAGIPIVNAYHKEKFLESDVEMLAPLLAAQPYINKVIATEDRDMIADYDLDSFRGVMWRSFTGNYLEGYFRTFNIPYTSQDIITPWLTAEPKSIAPIVIARTFRYRNPNSITRWKQYVALDDFDKMAIFVGHEDEYNDFVETFCSKTRKPELFKPKDFLELAQVIAGSYYVISNQTFVYSLAQGLGKATSLETIPDRTLDNNECFFNRPDCYYF